MHNEPTYPFSAFERVERELINSGRTRSYERSFQVSQEGVFNTQFSLHPMPFAMKEKRYQMIVTRQLVSKPHLTCKSLHWSMAVQSNTHPRNPQSFTSSSLYSRLCDTLE